MKNNHFDHKRHLAKEYARKTKGHNTLVDGVSVFHCYDEPKELSWWDDFGFYLGGQFIMVWRVHPRMAMMDEIESKAYDTTVEKYGPYPFNKDSMTPTYTKLGKTGKRKKPLYYTFYELESERRVWHDKWKQEQAALYYNNPITIKPKIKIEQLNWCRGVEITYPVELLTKDDVVQFAKKIKSHMKGETDMFDEVLDYVYTGEQFIKEHKLFWLDNKDDKQEVAE